MKFKLEFDMNNAAFDNATEAETSRILIVVGEQIEQGKTDGIVMDYNGNRVGQWSIDNDND